MRTSVGISSFRGVFVKIKKPGMYVFVMKVIVFKCDEGKSNLFRTYEKSFQFYKNLASE